MYWNGQAEEAYGRGLEGVRKGVFLTSKSVGRAAQDAEKDLETSLRLLKTDYLDLWQLHNIQGREDIEAVLKSGGAMEAFEAAKKAGKCRFIGFTGHFDPEAHVALLKAYGKWDTVMMPVHAADHAYLSFEQIALPVAVERGVATQAMKIFGKANLLRSLSSSDCLRYALSQPGVEVAVCGCGTVGQMEDNIRAVQSFRKMTPEECAAVRKRAVSGAGIYTGTTLEEEEGLGPGGPRWQGRRVYGARERPAVRGGSERRVMGWRSRGRAATDREAALGKGIRPWVLELPRPGRRSRLPDGSLRRHAGLQAGRRVRAPRSVRDRRRSLRHAGGRRRSDLHPRPGAPVLC